MTNTDLLKRTLQHIETHPNEWDQERWVTKTDCGTSYCFAGWALMLSEVPIIATQLNEPTVEIDNLSRALARAGMSAIVNPDDCWSGTRMTVRDAAETLLGLRGRALPDPEDNGLFACAADVLFEADNSLDDLREYVAGLCGETTETAAF